MDSGIKSQVASSSWTNEEPIWMGELTKLGGGGGGWLQWEPKGEDQLFQKKWRGKVTLE